MNYFPRNPPKRTIRGVSNDTDLILFTSLHLANARKSPASSCLGHSDKFIFQDCWIQDVMVQWF